MNHADIHGSEDADPGSPESKASVDSAAKKPRAPLMKSASMTFGNFVRYYSNLLQGSNYQNRRTSITTGGRLEYPELELLPPQLPGPSSEVDHHTERFDHFKKQVREDADTIKEYVNEEENKLEKFVRKEEDGLKMFVNEEESRLGDLVRKEEDKIQEYVREEEAKMMHFRAGSLFGSGRHYSRDQHRRRDTMIGPNEDLEAGPTPLQGTGSTDAGLLFDGAVAQTCDVKQSASSKAEVWSDLYKECLARPVSPDMMEATERARLLSSDHTAANTMPPPALKPVKPRSPEQPKKVNPTASIRRFPSVTVIDDRKGHCRSVSLISVKTSHSTGFERASTQDLLELVQAREQQERKKLLDAVGGES